MKFSYLTLCSFIAVNAHGSQPGFVWDQETCGRTVLASNESQMPWMVHLKVSNINGSIRMCGGFIIDKDWVMTAAHCLQSFTSVEMSAGHSTYISRSNSQSEETMTVQKNRISLHPDFDQRSMSNDIGLIHLAQPFRWNDFIQPICILDQLSCVEQSTVGFCTDNLKSATWEIGHNLQMVDLNIVPKSWCQSFDTNRQVGEQQICARGQQIGGSCRGDSGAPLFCFHNGRAIAIGIMSYGPLNCTNVLPAVHQRICHHIPWIRTVIEPSQTVTIRNFSHETTPRPIGCPIPPTGNEIINTANGQKVLDFEILPVGAMIELSCKGHSPRQVICTTFKTWFPPMTICDTNFITTPPTTTPLQNNANVPCFEKPTLNNALIFEPIILNSLGAQLVGTCYNGYRNGGSAIFFAECLPTMEWSDLGTCKKVCPETPDVGNGVVLAGYHTVGSKRSVSCLKGFALLGANITTCLETGQWSVPGYCFRGFATSSL